MRFLVLLILGFFGVVLSGSCTPLLEIAGISIDLLLLIIVPLALIDRSAMPIIFAAATGFLLDVMYSTIIGMTSLTYTLAAAAVYFIARRADRLNFLMVFSAGIGAYLIKEIIMAAIVIGAGVRETGLMHTLTRVVLPGAFIEGVLILPAYWLLSKLMRNRFMRKRRIYADELS